MNIRASFSLNDEDSRASKTATSPRERSTGGDAADFSALLEDPRPLLDKSEPHGAVRGQSPRRTSRPPRPDSQGAAAGPAPAAPPPPQPTLAVLPVGADVGTVPDFRGLIAEDDVRASSAVDALQGAHEASGGAAKGELSFAVDAGTFAAESPAPNTQTSSARSPSDSGAAAPSPVLASSEKPAHTSRPDDVAPAAPSAAGAQVPAGDLTKTAPAQVPVASHMGAAANASTAGARTASAPSSSAKSPAAPSAPQAPARPSASRDPNPNGEGGGASAGSANRGERSNGNRHVGADADAAATTPAARATPVAAAAPEAVPATSAQSPSDKGLTSVNSVSPTVKDPAVDGSSEAMSSIRSAQNQRVMRSAAHGELDHPELGRVAVSARLKDGEVDVRVSAQRAETATFLTPHADGMAADVRAANVPVARIGVDHGGGALPQSTTSSGDGGATPRDQSKHQEPDAEGNVVVSPSPKRVRIVL